MEKIAIKKIIPFVGQHCETTATGTLLNQLGIHLSEAMLFGLGEGLGYIIWNMKTMDFPFIGGRIKTDQLTKNICHHLSLKLEIHETSSTKKAWNQVKSIIDQGKVVGLKLDCYHLEYFSSRIHFAGHYVAMYDYDDQFAYLVDTDQQGGLVKTTLKNLGLARNEKGPMSSKNLSYSIAKETTGFDIEKAIISAVHSNAKEFLNPPIKNLYYKGILKTANMVKKWFEESPDIERQFTLTAMLMERAGTGGSLFRNLYRDFLKESYEITNNALLYQGFLNYKSIAKDWSTVSVLFEMIGKENKRTDLEELIQLLKKLSSKEETAMRELVKIT